MLRRRNDPILSKLVKIFSELKAVVDFYFFSKGLLDDDGPKKKSK